MKNENIVGVYIPKSNIDLDLDLWVVVQTNCGFYEIRTGAYRKLKLFDKSLYENIDTIKSGYTINRVWTDGETVFIELSDLTFIVIGCLEINSNGTMVDSVFYMNFEDIGISGDSFESDSTKYIIEPMK